MEKLHILMPSYNESASLEKLLPQLIQYLKGLKTPFQITLVNDLGYIDTELVELQDRFEFQIINNPYNLGSQKAVVYGLKQLTKENNDETFIVMDGDGQDDFRAIPELIKATSQNRIALAQRVGKRPEPFAFRFFYTLYKLFFYLFASVTPDYGNYCAFHSNIGKRIAASPLFNVTFSLCLPLIADTVKIPVQRLKRIDGKSKVGYNGLFSHAVQSLLPYLSTIAIRTAVISLVIGGLGVVLVGVLFTLKFCAPAYVMPNWVTIVTVGVVLLAVQLFTLCVILFLNASLYRFINYHSIPEPPLSSPS